MKRFEDVFPGQPVVSETAPGRVNLLGEHTDYNDGFVLPTAIPQRTRVTLGLAEGDHFSVYAADLSEQARFTLDEAPELHFASYIYGCIRLITDEGAIVPPLNIHVDSDVPIGVGLSSSAALEVATLRSLRSLLKLELDDLRIAQLAQLAEIHYAHVNCGIMDQMASSLADEQHMLFIDTRSLERRLLPLPEGAEILVIDSGIARSLAESKYNERRSECEAAAHQLGVPALRDVKEPLAVERLPEPLRRRARHVVTENNRVLRAAEGVSAAEFGTLMNASHSSLSQDYEVSILPLDRLVHLLQHQPGVYGARLTGAGFGGACVALCEKDRAVDIAAAVLSNYNTDAVRGRLLVPAFTTTQ